MTDGAPWPVFAHHAPGLADFGRARLDANPSYLATVRPDVSPRVHPITAIVAPSVGLFVFMEPDSPKAHDLIARSSFALHNGVADNEGTGGEFSLRGHARLTKDPSHRVEATNAASYEPADRYLLFHLTIAEARALTYGDIPAPFPRRWRHGRS